MTVEGARRHSPTFTTIESAAEWAQHVLQMRERQGPLIVTIRDAIDLLVRDLEQTEAREGTFRFYRNHHARLCKLIGSDVGLHSINSNTVASYIRKRQQDGVSASTIVTKELATLRRMMQVAAENGFHVDRDARKVRKVRKGDHTGSHPFQVLRQDRIYVVHVRHSNDSRTVLANLMEQRTDVPN